jgi:hypothetical protein
VRQANFLFHMAFHIQKRKLSCRTLYKMSPGEIGWGDVDWIGLALDRDQRKALVNAVMNLLVHNMLGSS